MSRRLAVCCAPQFLIAFDFGVLTICVAPLAVELAIPAHAVPLVFAAYSLPFGSLLLACGRLVDRAGPGPVLVAGLAVFAAGVAGAAAAPGMTALLLCRAVQGAGAAAMTPAALALATPSFPAPAERSRALSWYATSISVGFVAGALLAGAAGQLASWRPAVAATAVVAAAALVAAVPAARVRAVAGAAPGANGLASVLATAAAISASLALCALSARFATGALLALCGVSTLLLAAAARRTGSALVPRRLAADRRFRLVVAGGSLVTATGVTGTLLLSLYLQDVRGHAPLEVAATFSLFGSTAFAGRRLSAALVGRSSDLGVLRAGLTLQGLALVLLATAVGLDPSVPALLALTAAFGFGHVVANAGVAFGIARGPAASHGIAAAVVATAQYAGAALGPLLLVGTVAAGGGAGAGIAAAGGVALAGAAAVAVLRPPPHQRRRPPSVRSKSPWMK